MLEDQEGSLWFGTFGGGVVCFNGKNFTQYTRTEGLSNNTVNSIIQDKSGNYWMATSGGGISRFDGKEFTHYTTRQGLAGDQVRSLYQDKEGKIWIGTFGNGISCFDGVSFTNYSEKEGFPATHIASIFQDKTGNLWFGTYNDGLIRFDGRHFYQYTEKQGLSDNTVLTVMQECDGVLWFGTSGGGISRYDGESFQTFNKEDGLTNNYIRCNLVGRQGNLWFGTRDGGLIRYDKELFTHYTDNEGLAGSKVFGITQDRKGNLWFTSFGSGITRYDGNIFESYSLKESVLNDFVYSILESKDGKIWFGSDGGGITSFDGVFFNQWTQKEGLCHNSVRCMLEDRNQQIWVGTYGGGVSRFDGRKFVNYSVKEGLSSDKIMCIYEDRDGNIWFGTDGGGITRYDGRKFTRFSAQEGLNSNIVISILQDNAGVMWFGTSGGGLIRFDGNYSTAFTRREGLSSNFITSLRQDKHGNLLIGTRNGPNILKADQMHGETENTKSGIFKNYSYEDGFLGIGCNLNALFEDKNGLIWMGSTNRLTAFRPWEEVPDTTTPQVKIANIQLFNEDIPWSAMTPGEDESIVLNNNVIVSDFKFSGLSKWYFLPENLSLAHSSNYLRFSYICISQNQTSKIRYQYKLEGMDSHWSSNTNLTSITYGNLKPGHYTFRVKAMNSAGVRSDEATYSFSIRSPWWKTWWFYSLIFAAVIVLIYIFIKWREINHRLQRKILSDRIEEQTHELTEKYRELESKNIELQTVNSEKDRFFSIIAHDVRGPLSTFMLYTEVMSENLHSYEMKDLEVMTKSMKDSASSLFKLLENLLEWSRMQQGLIRFTLERLNVVEVLNNSFEPIHEYAKNKSIALIIDIPSGLEVGADKNMLESVLRNLLSNALKYTPREGKVTVSARSTANGFVEIKVTDTGIGMEESMLRDLFKIDVHNSRKGTEGEPSAGLGLLLCSDFVAKMNGKIWVESAVNQGSTFFLLLPSVT